MRAHRAAPRKARNGAAVRRIKDSQAKSKRTAGQGKAQITTKPKIQADEGATVTKSQKARSSTKRPAAAEQATVVKKQTKSPPQRPSKRSMTKQPSPRIQRPNTSRKVQAAIVKRAAGKQPSARSPVPRAPRKSSPAVVKDPVAGPRPTAASSADAVVLALHDLVPATVLRRPSNRNKSPYVGDVKLSCGREAICHMPSLDMGGKCVPGTQCLLKVATDKQGNPVGAKCLGPYGTPKCEFILQLINVLEPENAPHGAWVGAHPSLGEKICHQLISSGRLTEIGPVQKLQREVTGVAGTDMRCDFLCTTPAKRVVLEVKTVVDTDYHPDTAPKRKGCVFLGKLPYSRAGIFPWGGQAQVGPDGEKVVSARAIKHVDELTAIASGQKKDKQGPLAAGLVFVVVRGDCHSFRPNADACPSFHAHCARAHNAGVQVLAHKVSWRINGGRADAVHDGKLEVQL